LKKSHARKRLPSRPHWRSAGGGEKLIIRPIVMKLTPEEISQLVKTLLDEDEERSFAFLVECLKPKLISATRDH
jgi:hypothetical protein